MRSFLLVFFGTCLHCILLAQPGMSVSYQNMEAAYWNLLEPEGPTFFKSGFGAGIHYRIPISKGSMLFVPGISYNYFEKLTSETGQNQAHQLQLRAAFRIFPMDIFLNCDCPTYRKGLFAEVFAGWSRWDLAHREIDIRIDDVAFSPLLGLAAGFSIPYGPNVIVSPSFRYTFFPSVTWEGLGALRNPDTDPYFREETFIRQMSFEIHVLFGS